MFHQGEEQGFSASLKPGVTPFADAAGVGGAPFAPRASGLHTPPHSQSIVNFLAQPFRLLRLTRRNSFLAPMSARLPHPHVPESWRMPRLNPAWSRPLSSAQTPPSRCLCCHHVAREGPDVTLGGTAQAQKRGRGDSTCCVAAREPDTVVLRPCGFQPPDHVSLSRAAAAPAQQQQQLRGRGAVPAAARWPQQFLGGATHEQQQWQR